jgi:hypothetical protein
MLIDFGAGSRQLFTATVNQKVTYGLATILSEPENKPPQASMSELVCQRLSHDDGVSTGDVVSNRGRRAYRVRW